jgi:hypothetical protein
MVWTTIRECHAQLLELMFGWRPLVDLSKITDSMAERQPGWSFLQEPSNRLQLSFKHLHRQAWDSKGPGLMQHNRWSESHCTKYLRSVEAFCEKLFRCTHFIGGHPGRGTEVATVRWCNTRQVSRNIFIYHGRVIVVVEYHKARHSTNNSFYVARVLPALPSRMMFEYITYVRPFAEALSHQLGRLPTNDTAYTHNRPYLFTGAHFQPYSTTHLSRAVQRQSQRVGLGRLTFARY